MGRPSLPLHLRRHLRLIVLVRSDMKAALRIWAREADATLSGLVEQILADAIRRRRTRRRVQKGRSR